MRPILPFAFSACLFAVCSFGLPPSWARGTQETIRVGIYQNKPKVFLDETVHPAGFWPDLLGEIAEAEDWSLEYVPCEWEQCLQAVESAELELMVDVAYSPARERRFDFNQEVVLASWSVVYARRGVKLHSILDLDQKRVAVLEDSIQYDRLAERTRRFDITPQFVEVADFEAMFRLLDEGKVEAGVVNHFFGARVEYQYPVVKTNILVAPSQIHFIVPKGTNGDLLQAIDRHLKRLKADPHSTYYQAIEGWLEPEKPLSRALIKRVFISSLVSAAGLGVVSIVIWNYSLRKEIERRKQAQKALRESEAHLRDITDGVPGAVIRYVLHPDGSDAVSYMSPGCLQLWEIQAPVAEHNPKILWDVIHPDDLPGMQASVMKSAQTLTPWSWEWRITTYLNHCQKWVRGTGNPERLANGDVVWTTVILDISDRKRAELALRQSEARWQFALEGAGDGVWDWNAQTNKVFFSPQWKAMLGYAEQEVGDSFDEWDSRVHPDDKAQCYVDLDRHFRGEVPVYQNEHRMCCKDSSYKWILARGKVIEWTADGQPLRVIGTHTDISDRKKVEAERLQAEKVRLELKLLKQAEERLRKRDAHLRTAQRVGQLGSWEFDVQSGKVTWSEEVFRIFGIPLESGAPTYDELQPLFHPDDRPYHYQTVQGAIENASPYELECRIYRSDGTLVYLLARGEAMVDDSGQTVLLVGTVQDITKRKQHEEQLRQLTANLEASNRELEQFAYVASHDLQEPLRAVSNFAQLLAKRYQGQLDTKADLYIEMMVDGATRMQQQVRDLLSYSRVGRHELHWQLVDCNALLSQVQQDLRMAIADTEAVLIAEPLPTVMADARQLGQLLQNLLSNALKYRSDTSPQIYVTVKNIQYPARTGETEAWLFSVRDNGIGIDPQYAERIFGIFQRLHTREEYPGTGLGLAICQKIVERHGGRIWVESQLGQGATFYFTLPIVQDCSHVNLFSRQSLNDSPG